MRLIHLWQFLPVVSWLALVAVGAWSFFTLSDLGEFRTDGSPRTAADKAVPYVFLLLVPIGLWMARKEFRRARDEIPLADARAERTRQQRQIKNEARANLANQPPLSEEIKAEALETLDQLRTAGVLRSNEVEHAEFLQLCESYFIESGDLYETAGILALYSESHGDFANAFFIPDQVEVYDKDIVAVIEGFARLAQRSADIKDVRVSVATAPNAGANRTAFLTLKGKPETIEFAYHSKSASGELMNALAARFDPSTPYAVAYFDSIYLVTCLPEEDRAALNAALDSEYDVFARFPA